MATLNRSSKGDPYAMSDTQFNIRLTSARERKLWQRTQKESLRIAEDFVADDGKSSEDSSVEDLVPWAATKFERRTM